MDGDSLGIVLWMIFFIVLLILAKIATNIDK